MICYDRSNGRFFRNYVKENSLPCKVLKNFIQFMILNLENPNADNFNGCFTTNNDLMNPISDSWRSFCFAEYLQAGLSGLN